MKPQGIIISLMLILGRLMAQVPADSLLGLEYNIFHAGNAEKKQALLVQKVNLYWRYGQIDAALQSELQRTDLSGMADYASRTRALWNAAITSYLNNESALASGYLRAYREQTGDTSTAVIFLQALTEKFSDSTGFIQSVQRLSRRDPAFSSLMQFHQLAFYERPHRAFYKLSSALVPGSGTMMNGDVGRGLVSLAIACSSVYGISQLVQSAMYINAAGWTMTMGLKFYTGNLRLTTRTFEKKENRKKSKLAENCRKTVLSLMQTYPLSLR